MSVGKKKLVWNFLSVGEKNVGWKKHFVGWKKNVRWKISPAVPGNVRTLPGMQDRKTSEAGKTPWALVEKKNVCWKKKLLVGNFFLSVGEKKCWLEKKISVGKFHLPF